MTPTVRSSAQNQSGFAAAITVSLAASTAVEDTVVLIQSNDYYSTAAFTTPTSSAGVADWTERADAVDGGAGNNAHVRAWVGRITTAGAQTVTANQSTNSGICGQAVVLVGSAVFDVAAGAGSATSSTSIVAPTVDPTVAEGLLLCAWATAEAGGTFTVPASMTERGDGSPSGVLALASATEALTSGALTGTRTATFSVSAPRQVGVSLVMRDPAVTVNDPTPAGVTVGSPGGETVEALSINVILDDPAPGGAVASSPAGETIAVDVAHDEPAGVTASSPAGETVDVATAPDTSAGVSVSSPGGETLQVDEPGLPAGGQPHVTVWAVNRTTGALIPLPHCLKVDLSPQRNSPGAFQVDYPAFGLNFELLRSEVEDQRRRVEVELWVGGRRFNAMRGYLLQASGDDVAESSVWTFSGHFLEWRMTDARLARDPADEKGEVTFGAKTPGAILAQLVAAAQARGTLTGLNYASFTSTLDSLGQPWLFNFTGKFTPYKTTYLGVLARLVSLGMCEWEITLDHKLHLYNPGGRGRDLTLRQPPVRLKRGTSLTESQRRIDLRAVGTDLYGTGADGLFASAVDATARARVGAQIERDVDSNNLDQQGALTAFVQNALPLVTEPTIELTHGLVFGSTHPAPVSGFRVGDWLYSDVGRGMDRVRVVQWVLSQDVNGVVGSVTLNDTIGDALSRLQQRLDALSDGSAVVGTSQPPPTDDTLAPAAPTGVTAGSVAYSDGAGGTLASLTVGWTAVTLNADFTVATDVSGYRVEWRQPTAGGWQLGAVKSGGGSTSTTFGDVPAGVVVQVQVFCYDYNGNTSAASTTVELTTQDDNTAPPVPSTAVVSPYLGQLKIRWDGLGSAGETMPADLDFVEVHLSLASGFTPTTATLIDTFSNVASERVATDLTYGVTYYVRLVAQDRAGNRSAPSAQGSANPETVVSDDVFAGAIGSLQLADLAVTTAKINDLAVNNAKIGDLSVGKLTAGIMTAIVTMSGEFRTAASGQRMRMGADGLEAFLADGTTKFFDLDVAAQSLLVVGEYRTAFSGERIVINASGISYKEMRFYPTSGSGYASILGNTVGSTQAFIRIRGSDATPGTTGFIDAADSHSSINYGEYPDPIGGPLNLVSAAPDGVIISGHRGIGYVDVDADGGLRAGEYYSSGLGPMVFSVQNAPGGQLGSGNGLFRCFWNGSNIQFVRQDTNTVVKTFIIDHPNDPSRYLVHATTESPHNGVEYWDTVVVEDGEAVVQLPPYFEALTANQGRVVLLTAVAPTAQRGRPDRVTPRRDRIKRRVRRELSDAAGRPTTEFEEVDEFDPHGPTDGVPLLSATYPRNGQFKITATGTVPETLEVFWLVKAVRKDVPPLDVEPLKASTTVAGVAPYRYIVPAA